MPEGSKKTIILEKFNEYDSDDIVLNFIIGDCYFEYAHCGSHRIDLIVTVDPVEAKELLKEITEKLKTRKN